MERTQNIAHYRGRLDKTLASHDLANESSLRALVKNQMLRSSEYEIEDYTENVVEKRTKEVSNGLQMLRSTSMNYDDGSKSKETYHRGWKLKQDTEEYRVMYREGPEGSPFHTLLVEGYVDGPIDVCLCISWETILYKKWWPQTSIPTFKILSSECLQKVRIGEQISLVRMKVSWPLSAREAVVHYFEFEYFQDDLVVVLFNSISDLESIERSTHGFTKDGIPDVQDVIRIDLVGVFALQKVNADRSYFRTMVNMDIKLDFIPPSFINFISRQLIGSGFRLYQKEVASVSKGDEDFGKALKDQLYARIREAIYSDGERKGAVEPEGCSSEVCILPEEHLTTPILAEEGNTERKDFCDDHATESFPDDTVATDYIGCGEIEEIKEKQEEEIKNSRHLEQDQKEIYRSTAYETAEKRRVNYKKNAAISPDVKQALETLDRVISIIREYGLPPQTRSLQCLGNEQSLNFGNAVKDSKSSEDGQVCSNLGVCDEVPKNKMGEGTLNEPRISSSSLCSRRTGSNSYSRDGNNNKIVPASPEEEEEEEDTPNTSETQQTAFCSSGNETREEPTLDRSTNDTKLVSADANGIYKNSPNKGKNYRLRFCCLHPFLCI